MSPYAKIARAYSRADADTVRRGREWYARANEEMRILSDETGYTLEQAVAVMSILSPGCQLATNLRWTREALETKGEGRVGRFPARMGAAVRAVLDSPEYAHEYVTGPKVGAFFRAILGDEDALVLDRWALYAAGHADRERTIADKDRRRIERAYRRAAHKFGETVRDFQAIVWIAVREATQVQRRGEMVDIRYPDPFAA